MNDGIFRGIRALGMLEWWCLQGHYACMIDGIFTDIRALGMLEWWYL